LADSIKIYEKACKQGHYNTEDNAVFNLERYYISLIRAMFYELVTDKSSDLLSILCSVNDIHVEVINFSIDCDILYSRDIFNLNSYNLLPIVEGLNAAFTKDLDRCSRLYLKHRKDIFQGRVVENNNFKLLITAELEKLDNNIGYIISSGFQSSHDQKQQSESIKKRAVSNGLRDLNVETMSKAIKDIISMFGIEILTDSKRFQALIKDFMFGDSLKIEQQILIFVVNIGIVEILLRGVEGSATERKRMVVLANSILIDQYGFMESRSESILGAFALAFGWLGSANN